MLYSIGYQHMKNSVELITILQTHQITCLIDVRSRPSGRNASFRKDALAAKLKAAGIRYLWRGNTLGGFSKIKDDAIAGLATWQENHEACLMCMEADPDKCHRKYEIARRLEVYSVKVEHLSITNPNK